MYMKIFLSYSCEHNAPLVKKINSSLTSRGYQVWTHTGEHQQVSDQLSIKLGMQQTEVQKILLEGGQYLQASNGIQAIDMSNWKQYYNLETQCFDHEWYLTKLKQILLAITNFEIQSLIAQKLPLGSKQWQMSLAEALWEELVKVGGEVEQLSRVALYDLPKLLMQLTGKDRTSIIGNIEGWNDSVALISQVYEANQVNKQHKLAEYWKALGLQLKADLLGVIH